MRPSIFTVITAGLVLASACSAENGTPDTMTEDTAGADSAVSDPALRDGRDAALQREASEDLAPASSSTGNTPYSYRSSHDLFGYYMADEGTRFGDWRLHHMYVGGPDDFAAFDEGGQMKSEAPVWLEFWPVDGEMAVNELGGEYAVGAHRVRPDSFVIEDGRFDFIADDAEVGAVLLSGRLYADRLDNSAEDPAFTGGLEVAGDRVRNMSLHYYGGD